MVRGREFFEQPQTYSRGLIVKSGPGGMSWTHDLRCSVCFLNRPISMICHQVTPALGGVL